jgi:Fanconi anemia group M protein
MDAMSITNVEIRTEEDSDVSTHVQPMRIEWIEVDLSKEIAEAVALLGELMDEKVAVLQQFGMQISKKTARGRLSQIYRSLIEHRNMAALGHFAIFYNAFHGAELLETEGPYAFIKFTERLLERKNNRIDWRFTQAMNKVRALEHPKMALLLRLLKEREGKRIIVFAQYRDQVTHTVETINASGFKSKQFLGKGKGGVATQKTQKETLEEFGRGDFDILVASSIGEEGIDVPAADTAIFYEPVPSEIRSIQRRGRVGRVKEGEALILVTRGTRDETFRYVSVAREKKMKGIIKKLSTGEIKHRPRKKKTDGDGPESRLDPSQTEQAGISSFFK